MKRQPYSYPEGRRRLEPVAIIILAVVMSVASAQVVITGIERIIELAGSENPQGPNMAWPTLSIIGLDITVKLGIIIAFFRSRHNPSVATLIQDARNDVVNNTVSIACGLLAYHFWAFLDPIGAIGISSFIITGWVITLISESSCFSTLNMNGSVQRSLKSVSAKKRFKNFNLSPFKFTS